MTRKEKKQKEILDRIQALLIKTVKTEESRFDKLREINQASLGNASRSELEKMEIYMDGLEARQKDFELRLGRELVKAMRYNVDISQIRYPVDMIYLSYQDDNSE